MGNSTFKLSKNYLFLLLFIFSFFHFSTIYSQTSTPCDAVRWDGNGSDSWNPDGTIQASGDEGIVGCGSAAATQSNIRPNSTYDSSMFQLVPDGTCNSPNTGAPVTVTPPNEGQDIIWIQYDVRAFAGSFDYQIVSNDNIGWILFSAGGTPEQPSPGAVPSNCSHGMDHVACGDGFNNTFATGPTPVFSETTNLYLAIWDQDAGSSLSVNFKARFGCGDSDVVFCGLEENQTTTQCNADGTYTVTTSVNGANGNYVVNDNTGQATSVVVNPDPLLLTNLGATNPILSGTVSVTYPLGVDYNFVIRENGDGNAPDPINSSECIVTISGSALNAIVPTFAAVAAICEGETLADLPTESTNGIAGTWSPALDNTTTTEYTFTPAEGECADTATLTIEVGAKVVPAFEAVAAICEGEALADLPTESTNGITGTWSPALDNTTTTEYTFTPAEGECADTATLTIEVGAKVVPTFAAVAAICEGEALADLPTESTNGITGTWSPALDNTTTTEYTFTPAEGECADTATLTIEVGAKVVPAFEAVAAICEGEALADLPTESTNGITGTWSPALDNTTTTEYTFTPAEGECADTATLTIEVGAKVVPAFEAVAAICEGEALADLPTESTNGITGTWSPALDNTTTTEYTFTPAEGECADTATLTIEVGAKVVPAFEAVAAICEGEALADLPTESTNGIAGTWSPALDNTTTTEYTFTPAEGECADTATLTIEVGAKVVPAFAAVAAICEGETLADLPTTSTNGITGTWSPALDNTSTTEYTFTPAEGECADTATLTIEVGAKVVPTFAAVAAICEGETLADLPTESTNGIAGTWSPALDNTTTTEYTFTPAEGECADTATLTIEVGDIDKPTISGETTYCGGGNGVLLDAGAGYSSYLWYPNGEITQTITATTGDYSVTVTNASDCESMSDIYSVKSYEILSCSIVQDELASNYQAEDGVATVSALGGSGDYTYLWDNGETTQTASTLTYGMHSVTITDKECGETTCEIFISKNLICSVNLESDATCENGSDGVASVTAYGGFKPYEYSWDNSPFSNESTVDNLSPGTHTVVVKDATGATTTCSVIVTTDAMPIGCSIEQNELASNYLAADGIATVRPNGGSGSYEYLWDNGETTAQATGLTYGMHSVTVTDLNGCGQSTCELFIAKRLICSVVLKSGISVAGASDGSASVSAYGGYAPYTYSWDGGEFTSNSTNNNLSQGLHTVIVKDTTGATTECSVEIPNANAVLSCSIVQDALASNYYTADGVATVTPIGGDGTYVYLWDNGEITQTANMLTYGIHSVLVSDTKGNTTTCEIFIAKKLICSISVVSSPSCYDGDDGAATVHAYGGFAPYMYSWNGGDFTDVPEINTLSAGNHEVIVKDATGATSTCSINIQNSMTEISCHIILDNMVSGMESQDGAATVMPKGGSGEYTYLWDNGETTATVTNLGYGNHSVLVTDKDSCGTTSCEIYIGEQLSCTVVQQTTEGCDYSSLGIATVSAMGGHGNYSYKWDNGEILETASNLSAGIHTVTVTDASGKMTTCSVDIMLTEVLSCAIVLNKEISTYLASDGSASVIVSGGAAPFTYEWDNGGSYALNNSLTGGLQKVLITDKNGCTTSCEIMMEEPAPNEEVCDGIDNDLDGYTDEGFDSDNDGVADCFDICEGGDDNLDSDGDGTPDFCDTCNDDADDDGDGVKNCDDICEGGDDNLDTDGDGTPDFCEEEVCDGIDNNGDGQIDEGLDCSTDPDGGCETAFAYYAQDNTCFLDDETIKGNRWGWTNFLSQEGEYTMDLYSGAGQCDLSKGQKSGNVNVNYVNGKVSINIDLLEGFVMNEVQIFVGDQKYPMNNGKPTVAPGQYPFVDDNLNSVTEYDFGPIDVSSDGIYVIIHAVTCAKTEESSKYTGKTNVTAFPTVFGNELTVQVESSYASPVRIEMYDMNGRLLVNKQGDQLGIGTNQIKLNVGNLAPDMYIIILKTNREKFVRKVISKK